MISGYTLADFIPSPVYGIATYVANNLLEYDVTFKDSTNDVFVINISIAGINNVYKRPSKSWGSTVLPQPIHPSVLQGDFNSHHESWGYQVNNLDGEKLADWYTINDLSVLFNAKDKPNFHSARWNSGTNPDLTIV